MYRGTLLPVVLTGFFLLPLPVRAQDGSTAPPPVEEPTGSETPRPRFRFGPELGFYFLTSDRAADTFGRVFTNVGFGFGGVRHARRKGETYFDLNVVANRRRGSELVLIPAGIAYRRSFAREDTAQINPYYGFGANVVGVHSRSDRDNLPSRFRFGAGGNVFAGVTYRDTGYLQARYLLMSDVRGFNLSGASLAVGFRF
ncbi:MAG: hypothetical protein SFU56_14775 [Capsulimonadales bacterium]|nr:hypothetical protein [Capsulimonadales bacterium]